MNKLLSRLTKREILRLPGFENMTNLSAPQLKRELRERVKALKLKRGARVIDFVPKAPEPVPVKRSVDTDEYKARMNKKIDDEMFSKLKSLPKSVSKFADKTNYLRYKNVDFYQKWFNDYLTRVKKGESLSIDLGDNKDQIRAFENVVYYLSKTPMQNQMITISAYNLNGNHHDFTLNNRNKSKLNTMLGIISGRIDITKKSTHDDFEYEETDFGTYFHPTKLYLVIRNIEAKNSKNKRAKTIKKKVVHYDKDNVVDGVVEESVDAVMNEILGGSFWPYINKSGINLEKYQIFSSFDKNNYIDNCFVYACKQSNLFDTNEIESLINVIKVRRVPSKIVKKVSEIFNKPIKITKLYDDGTSKISVDTSKEYPGKPCLNLLLFK